MKEFKKPRVGGPVNEEAIKLWVGTLTVDTPPLSLLRLSVATCKKPINNVGTDGARDLLGQRTQELLGLIPKIVCTTSSGCSAKA